MARNVGNDFEATFLGQMALAAFVAISGLKKVSKKPTPYNGPRKENCPPQNHYVPRHKNNRYINSYQIIPLTETTVL
jgi:hypothetical protein